MKNKIDYEKEFLKLIKKLPDNKKKEILHILQLIQSLNNIK